MFVSTLKELSSHPAVAEIVRKRGDVTVVLKPEWMNFNGTAYVVGKNAAEVLVAFNHSEVFRRVDLERAPKSVTFRSRKLWRDESGADRFFIMKQRCELVGIMDGSGPQYRAVETIEESGRPAWDTKDYVGQPVGISWRALEERPEEYGLVAKKKSTDLKVGTRVRFTEYSHPISNWCLAVDGESGTVVDNDGDYLYVKMDRKFDDLNEWENCLQWSLIDGDEFPFDAAEVRS